MAVFDIDEKAVAGVARGERRSSSRVWGAAGRGTGAWAAQRWHGPCSGQRLRVRGRGGRTPVDEYLNPDPQAVPRALEELRFSGDGQLVVLRSTVFPGVTGAWSGCCERPGHDIDVAFCPERIAEGRR